MLAAARAVIGGLLGSLLGLALGVGLCFAFLPSFLRAQDDYFDYDIFISLVMHGSIWGLVGGLGRPGLCCWPWGLAAAWPSLLRPVWSEQSWGRLPSS